MEMNHFDVDQLAKICFQYIYPPSSMFYLGVGCSSRHEYLFFSLSLYLSTHKVDTK